MTSTFGFDRRGRRVAGITPIGVILFGTLVAVGVSTQFLFQPFVWRHWPVDEILLGWTDILVARVTVGLAIGAALACGLALAARVRTPGPLATALLFTLLALAGALCGEAVLIAAGSVAAATSLPTLLFGAARWTVTTLAFAGLYLAWFRVTRHEREIRAAQLASTRAQGQLANLRLQALQAQIEPHFLFNTLATARRLGSIDPAQCERLLTHLIDFVSLSRIDEGAPAWSVEDELTLVRAYLGVVEMRTEGRLAVRFDVEPAARVCEAPPLALATLVENAVKHGVTPSTEPCEIVVGAAVEGPSGTRLRMWVADTGVGLRPSASGSGIGLSNTRARLRARHGDEARLTLAGRETRGVLATLTLPAQRQSG